MCKHENINIQIVYFGLNEKCEYIKKSENRLSFGEFRR